MSPSLTERLRERVQAARATILADASRPRRNHLQKQPLLENLEQRELLTINLFDYTTEIDTFRSQPSGIVNGPDGALWITDEGNPDRIIRMSVDGSFDPKTDVFTLSPTIQGPNDITVGPDGNLWITAQTPGNQIVRLSPYGELTRIDVGPPGTNPRGIISGPDGNLWFALPGLNGAAGGEVGRIILDPSRGTPLSVQTFPLPATAMGPNDFALGSDNKLYLTLSMSNQIAVIDPLAVTPTAQIVASTGANTAPAEIVTGSDGNLWFTLPQANALGRLVPGSNTLLPNIQLTGDVNPRGIVAGPDNTLYVGLEQSQTILRVTTAGVITPFQMPFGSGPNDLTMGSNGDIYVTNQLGQPVAGDIFRLDLPAAIEAQHVFYSGPKAVPLNNFVVGSFFDPSVPNPELIPNVIDNYEVSIDWGDGSPPTPFSKGGISLDGSNFVVRGTHTYAQEGRYPLGLTIRDKYVGTNANGSPVADNRNVGDGGRKVTVVGEVYIRNSPIMPSGQTINAIVGTPKFNALVATFTSLGGVPDQYKVFVDWGDGSAVALGSVSQTANGFNVTGDHNFSAPGTYIGTVSVEDGRGNLQTAAFTSIVDPILPVLPYPPIAAVAGVPLLQRPIATFSSTGALDPRFYQAIINWGDGTDAEPGLIQVTPDGNLVVYGDHTFTTTSRGLPDDSFIATIVLGTPDSPNLVQVQRPIQVEPPNPQETGNLTGSLDPADDCGASDHDFITNVKRPTFEGTADPGSIVQLYVRAEGSSTATLVGQAVVDSLGNWIVRTSKLADGRYTVTATASNRSGVVTDSIQIAPDPAKGVGPLVIDTVGPRINDLVFAPNEGSFTVTYQDNLSGMDQATVIDGINYAFNRLPSLKNRITLVTDLSTTRPANPTAEQVVVGSVNEGRYLVHGVYKLVIRTGPDCVYNGVHDVAGNGLDAEFYGDFPSGNRLGNINDNFEAYLRFNGKIVAPPSATQSTASPLPVRGTVGDPIYVVPRGINNRSRDVFHKLIGPPDFGTSPGHRQWLFQQNPLAARSSAAVTQARTRLTNRVVRGQGSASGQIAVTSEAESLLPRGVNAQTQVVQMGRRSVTLLTPLS